MDAEPAVPKSRSGRRPAKPKIRYQGVRARWSSARGWTFRAVFTYRGYRDVGPARLTQEEAAADYQQMRATTPLKPHSILTLDEALERAVLDARERGAAGITVRSYQCHADYLRQWFEPQVRVDRILQPDVVRFVRLAREDGRANNTLLQKDLPLLGRALELGGAGNCIPAAKQELRQVLKRVPPQMRFFEREELRSLIHRMREGVWRVLEVTCPHCTATMQVIVEHRPGEQTRRCETCRKSVPIRKIAEGRVHSIPSRHQDADLVQLLALTGVRSGELGRIRVCDVDMRRRQIQVVSKDRGHPRRLEIVDDLVAIVERLCAAAREREDSPKAVLVPDSMNRVTNLARRWKVRLEEPRLSGRALRHTFGTGLGYSGAAPIEMMGLLGHRNLSTTDRYTHEITRRRAEIAGNWARALFGGDDAAAPQTAVPPTDSDPAEP